MAESGCDIGLIGLGVMGKNFVLNMADKGFSVAVYNRTGGKTKDFMEKEVKDRHIRPAFSLSEFIHLLKKPRAVIMMVPAGKAVDTVIEALSPLLEPMDTIIDSGNSHYSNSDRRSRSLDKHHLRFVGMGISGGERGARFGPSLMPGGSPEGYNQVRTILEAASAKVENEPCVDYLGPGAAGHFVKMVHNGIEYGLEQLIAEAYDFMRRGLSLSNDELHDVFRRWNGQELSSYLMDITARTFLQKDDRSDHRLIDLILDVAGQKGTGIWSSQAGMELRVPIPTIDMAVSMRALSELKEQRETATRLFQGPLKDRVGDQKKFIDSIKNALYASWIITFAQGMALLQKASATYGYSLNLETICRIWRGGCIIRTALLETLRDAYRKKPDLSNLLLDEKVGLEVINRTNDWRAVVMRSVQMGIPVPAMAVSLSYFDAYRSARLPANLIQAQRDFFGAHTYGRIDAEGTFHTRWDN